MSGGVAYVYNPDGMFEENLNAEMVDLDALDDTDVDWLHGMIQAHVDATDSPVGQRILADWAAALKHFVKVMPRDFKKVLKAIAQARASGMTGSDVDKAIMAAASA
jgi:glutamate synthase (NADPH) large chain